MKNRGDIRIGRKREKERGKEILEKANGEMVRSAVRLCTLRLYIHMYREDTVKVP